MGMEDTTKNEITIVSGLPRSGTSMMMKMLEAGGMEILTDNLRKADVDNPKGYYELEKVKKIKEDSSWLEAVHGKVFKMISMLLYHLPKGERYRIIFMMRDMDEILASQRKMLERRRPDEAAKFKEERARQLYAKHLEDIGAWFEKQAHMDVIYINYNELIKEPLPCLQAVRFFLKARPNVEKMVEIVDHSLYRNRNIE